MRATVALIACWGLVLLSGCGKNEVTIEIRGGDGRSVRLDADKVEFKKNRLVEPGTFSFLEIKRGSYPVRVVAGEYLEIKTLELEAAPISGIDNYKVTFDIPAGSNTGLKRQGTIVYASTRTNVRNWDIFTIGAADGEIRQITDTREFEQHPSWSPDGRRILFTYGDVMSNIDVYSMAEDGSDRQPLTEHPERDQRPSWSPDGSTIAFESQRDGDVAIWLMDADGANKRKLTKGREPSWSPDGNRIVFTSGQFDDNDEIYTIGLDGSNRTRLTDGKKFDWFPNWAGQGDRLVFCSERFGGQELMLMRVDGTAQTRVTIAEKTYELEPVWSPDGRGVAYMGKMEGDAEYDIYVMEANGFDLDEMETPAGLPVNLTDNSDREDYSPDWRPF
ncbi:MAG: DUF5050 domain-containing protein [Candidatus Latescibacteria bacterium]|nr:DUF5050 domain-containing protein [Candidatus Latescibacterota bacterium]